MNCLYCGKEIGAFRLLRDSEFCSASHRTSYKDRLGRVLTRINEREAPPPPPAGFIVKMPPFPGNTSSALILWLSTGSDYRVRMTSRLPALITADVAGMAEPAEQTPAPCVAWMPAARPEPAERWIERSLAAPCDGLVTTALPAVGALSPVQPKLCTAWMSVPAAEPAARLVAPRPGTVGLPAYQSREAALLLVGRLAPVQPELCIAWMPVPAAEPVARLVAPGQAGGAALPCSILEPAFTLIAELEPLPVPEEAFDVPALCEHWIAAPQAEPVARLIAQSVAGAAALPHATLEPAFTLSAEVEPLSVPEEVFDPPALCEHWIAAPPAEPVASFLAPSNAAALLAPIAHLTPLFPASVAGAYVPVATSLHAISAAEPVMAGVWPCVADTPLSSIGSPIAICLPQIDHAVAPYQSLAPAAAAEGPAAEPAEALPIASEAVVPLTAAATLCAPAITAIPAVAPASASAQPCAGPEAEAVEMLLVASSAGPMVAAAPVRLQAFQVAGSEEGTVPGLDEPRIAATAAAPAPASGKPGVLQPISTIQTAAPVHRHDRPAAAIPRPALMAIEYHIQRTRSIAVGRPEWKAPRFEPLPPQFNLRAVLDKLEVVVQPKPKPAGIFVMGAPPPRHSHSTLMDSLLRVAASVMIVTTMWFGASALKRVGGSNVRRDESAFSSPRHTLTADTQTVNTKTESKGPVNWVRKSIANRASMQLADDFQSGMKSWGAEASQYAAGWQRNADGYVQTGALAIFKPTVNFTDYRLEFFGQIENKSVGWAVRARDEKNYHAMKFTVLEAGLRPIIALVQYNVVDGKAGRRTQTPLSVMVHNSRPMQVAVNVRGTHFVTSINGEEVDTFSDDSLASGGIGFFSEAGERARLYWTKVTKNDDWLGHVCAFLSGDSSATAGLVLPAGPGRTPGPWPPAGGGDTAIAAAWIGLPSLRRTHIRRQKPCNS